MPKTSHTREIARKAIRPLRLARTARAACPRRPQHPTPSSPIDPASKMDENPLVPLVHVLNNAAFDNSSSTSARHAQATLFVAPQPGDAIGHIEVEILHLSSRLHHFRTPMGFETQRDQVPAAAKAQPRPQARGSVSVAANPNQLAPEKQQPLAVHLGFDLPDPSS